MTEEQKQKVLEVLRANMLGVISTVSATGQSPESAVVAVSETDDLHIIFGTFNDTRKFRNIAQHPHVAFVIGWDRTTVQYEGIARMVDEAEHEHYRDIHLAKNPASKKFAFDEKQRFFTVTPRWIRYTDVSTNPTTTFELAFPE